MCGILGILGIRGDITAWRALAVKLANRIRHRGPDGMGVVVIEEDDGTFNILVHQRLSIVDISEEGRQPFVNPDNQNVHFVVNGEIFNFPQLREVYEAKGSKFHGHSDSQIVGVLYNHHGQQLVDHLDGMWTFILYDKSKKTFLAARDHVGIIPLYFGTNKDGVRFICSELKGIHDVCDANVQILLPGNYITNDWTPREWYNPAWYNMDLIPTNRCKLEELNAALTEAVREELMSDVPFGFLISGGVDSSLISSIAVRLLKEGKAAMPERGMSEIHSFCIGLEGSPDLEASRKVAESIGTTHHEFVFTVEEGIDAIPEVIYHVESYNPTTIRASTPMYLMARRIKALGIKMVLTGEGADEIFGGYLYFHKAPNKEELHKETVRKVRDLYKFDLLRANKSTMAWGLEVRPPFLNKRFIEYAMSIDPTDKWVKSMPKPIEKCVMRAAFDTPENPYLPNEVLWRQKEQFSDGVGYKWVDGIKAHAEKLVSEADWTNRATIYPINTPTSKEMFLFRRIFESHFPSQDSVLTVPFNLSIACSTAAAIEWDESFKKNTDESGRAVLGIHNQAETIKDAQQH